MAKSTRPRTVRCGKRMPRKMKPGNPARSGSATPSTSPSCRARPSAPSQPIVRSPRPTTGLPRCLRNCSWTSSPPTCRSPSKASRSMADRSCRGEAAPSARGRVRDRVPGPQAEALRTAVAHAAAQWRCRALQRRVMSKTCFQHDALRVLCHDRAARKRRGAEPLIDDFQDTYNFVRPHCALSGLTPAEYHFARQTNDNPGSSHNVLHTDNRACKCPPNAAISAQQTAHRVDGG